MNRLRADEVRYLVAHRCLRVDSSAMIPYDEFAARACVMIGLRRCYIERLDVTISGASVIANVYCVTRI